MPVEFSCDGCNRRLRAPDAKAGKRVNCPTCGKELQIPVMSTSSPISLPAAGAPLPNPLDKLAAAIPTAAEAVAGFQLSKPGGIPTIPVPTSPSQFGPAHPGPTPLPAQSIPSVSAPKPVVAQPIDIGLADEPVKPAPAPVPTSSSSNSGSASSSGIGGTLKPKPNAWRGGDKAPAMPGATQKPAAPKPVMPVSPAMPAPVAPLSLPMAAAAVPSPLVPVAPVAPAAPNPLDDIFKDIPQLAPVNAPAQFPSNAPNFGGLKPVTSADPFNLQGAALPTAAAPRWDQIASSANVGSSNPYAAPMTSSAGGYRRSANIESVRTIVMIPGVMLLVCYIILLLGTIINVVGNAIEAAGILANETDNPERTGYAVGLIFGSLISFALAIAGLFGSIKMIRLRSWGSALTASIMAIFPFYFCLPVGVWAVIVLSMDSVRSAFEANDRMAGR